jgi:hypothetical protein
MFNMDMKLSCECNSHGHICEHLYIDFLAVHTRLRQLLGLRPYCRLVAHRQGQEKTHTLGYVNLLVCDRIAASSRNSPYREKPSPSVTSTSWFATVFTRHQKYICIQRSIARHLFTQILIYMYIYIYIDMNRYIDIYIYMYRLLRVCGRWQMCWRTSSSQRARCRTRNAPRTPRKRF